MVKKLSLLFLLFVALSSHAQTEIDTSALLNALNQAPFIFEGKVIEQCTYEEPNSGIIYTNNIMEITKVIKGNLQCGTVSMITEGGEYLDRYMEVTHTTKFNVNVTGIFACNPNPYYYGNSCPSTSNTQILTPMLREFSEIHYYDDYVNDIAEGFNSQFHDINELYDFIQNFAGLSINDCNQQFRPQDWESNDWKKVEKIPFVEDNSWNTKYQTLAVGDQVKYTFSGFQSISGYGNTKYYECNVRVQSNGSGSYLQRGAFRLKYNPKAFGTNIANNIQVTLGNDFPSSVYGTSSNGGIQVLDKSDSVVSFIITRITGNRTELTSNPITFFSLKIPYDTCRFYPELEMIDSFSTINNFNLYTTSATGTTAYQYDTVVANGQKQGDVCWPEITNVYSTTTGKDTVAGGTNELVIIKGKHFGNNNGYLFLPDANRGNLHRNFIPLNHFDIQSWSDTAILFKVPSLADSISTSGAGYNTATYGTGDINVLNKLKVSLLDTSVTTLFSKQLKIKYSLAQNSKGTGSNYYKNNIYLWSTEPSGGYTFYLHPNISDTNMINCISAAIEYWKCIIGVDFRLASSPALWTDSTSKDGKSVIMIDSTYYTSRPEVIMSTFQFAEDACASSLISHTPFPRREIDIKINPFLNYNIDITGNIPVDSGKFDFYHTILHELGHAVGLKHVNQRKDLMYYASASGPLVDSVRIVEITYWDQEGGDTIMKYSTDLSSFGLTCSNISIYNMTMQTIGDSCRAWPLAIHPSTKNNVPSINIYPNPFRNTINIDFEEYSDNCEYQIYTIHGQLMNKGRLENKHNQISIENMPEGMCIINIKYNNQWITRKVVCSH